MVTGSLIQSFKNLFRKGEPVRLKESKAEKTDWATTFEEMVEEVGFGRAAVIYFDKLPEKFYSDLTFDQWMSIYSAGDTYSHKELKEKALEWFSSLSEEAFSVLTFKQWKDLYYAAAHNKEDLKSRAIKGLTYVPIIVKDLDSFPTRLPEVVLARMKTKAETGSFNPRVN